jgi:hypothetical protein
MLKLTDNFSGDKSSNYYTDPIIQDIKVALEMKKQRNLLMLHQKLA